jgi:GNAT superfamily N-acetyltransferase
VSFRVRRARPGEEAALLPMYEWLFAPPGSMPPAWDEQRALEALAEALQDNRSAVFVAETDGKEARAGLCTAYLELRSVRFGQRCWVEDLAVDPGQRSRGIGAALLEAASAWAREGGATHLELDTGEARADAQRFYERLEPAWRSISYAWLL